MVKLHEQLRKENNEYVYNCLRNFSSDYFRNRVIITKTNPTEIRSKKII